MPHDLWPVRRPTSSPFFIIKIARIFGTVKGAATEKGGIKKGSINGVMPFDSPFKNFNCLIEICFKDVYCKYKSKK